MDHQLSYLSLKPHLQLLRLGGFYQLDPKLPRWKILLHTFYMRLILTSFLIYIVQQLIKLYQVRNDGNKVIETMSLFLTYSDSVFKGVVFWKKADKVEQLLGIMKGELFNPVEQIYKELLRKTIYQAKVFLTVFNLLAFLTCFLWMLYPVIMFKQGKFIDFAIWLPFDNIHLSPQYYIVSLYVWIHTSWLGFVNTTMDSFISFFLAQCKTQLHILRLDLESLVKKSKEDVLSGASYKKSIDVRFKKILLHHSEILKFSAMIQDIFGPVLLYQFLVSMWIICTTAFRIVNVAPTSVEFLSMITYMSCILSEPLAFCFYGNEVTHESERLIESAYNMDWLEIPQNNKKDLIIFMERAKRPIRPMAAKLIPLSNTSFVSIVKSSYTFYAFLNNTGTKK